MEDVERGEIERPVIVVLGVTNQDSKQWRCAACWSGEQTKEYICPEGIDKLVIDLPYSVLFF
jgi:hypothetical protein